MTSLRNANSSSRSSANYSVRSRQHVRRNREADLFCRLQIYHELELRRLFDGQIGALDSNSVELAELASPAFAGHTFGMKTAISIPDKIFHDAERLSRRLKKSRSQIYVEAVTEYIARHDPEAVTEAMNRVCEGMTEYFDPAISAAARRALEDVEW